MRELFAPADQERLAEHLKTGTLTDEPQNADVFELLISDRTSRWVEVSSAVDEEGAGDEVIVLLQDVTPRVVAERRHRALEQELQSSRRLLEGVVGGTADAAFVKDRNGRYLRINNAGAAAMGLHAEEVVGRTDADLLPVDVAARIRQDDLAVMQTAQAHSFEEMLDNVRVFLATKSPYYDHTGAVAGVVGTARDITGRKRDEEYALLLNRAGEVLSSLDPEAAVRGVADLAVPDIADFCIVSLLEPSGRAAAAVIAHADPDKLDQLVSTLAPHGGPEPVCNDVLSAHRPQLLRKLSDAPGTVLTDDPYSGCRELLRDLGADSAIALPLPGHRGGLGTLILARTRAHAAFDEDDLFFGVELARRAAVALEMPCCTWSGRKSHTRFSKACCPPHWPGFRARKSRSASTQPDAAWKSAATSTTPSKRPADTRSSSATYAGRGLARPPSQRLRATPSAPSPCSKVGRTRSSPASTKRCCAKASPATSAPPW